MGHEYSNSLADIREFVKNCPGQVHFAHFQCHCEAFLAEAIPHMWQETASLRSQ